MTQQQHSKEGRIDLLIKLLSHVVQFVCGITVFVSIILCTQMHRSFAINGKNNELCINSMAAALK